MGCRLADRRLSPWVLVLFLFAASAFIDIPSPRAASGKEGIQVRVSLRDGTLIVGTLSDHDIPMKSRFGKVSFPTTEISQILLEEPDGAAIVKLINGDRITGRLEGDVLALETSFGRVKIPHGSLKKIVFSGETTPATGIPSTWKFNQPSNLGPNINSQWDERGLSLTADGNTLYFASDRPGGQGGHDIYTSTRVGGQWRPAQNVGSILNTPAAEHDPVVTPDGNRIFFATEVGVPKGYTRIWSSERIDGAWQQPVLLPGSVNRSGINNNPSMVSPDGRWLYWSSFGPGIWDIFRVDISDGTYRVVERIPEPVNSAGRDFASCLTPDARYLVFDSDNDGSNRHQIYYSAVGDEGYGNPFLMPFPFNGFSRPAFTVHFCSLTEGGRRAYFEFGDAPGGYGQGDFYWSEMSDAGNE